MQSSSRQFSKANEKYVEYVLEVSTQLTFMILTEIVHLLGNSRMTVCRRRVEYGLMEEPSRTLTGNDLDEILRELRVELGETTPPERYPKHAQSDGGIHNTAHTGKSHLVGQVTADSLESKTDNGDRLVAKDAQSSVDGSHAVLTNPSDVQCHCIVFSALIGSHS